MCLNNCGKSYKHKYSLTQHMNYECGGKKNFSCHVCKKNYGRKYSLKKHLILTHQIL